jgi:hypothetical protein
VNASIPALVLAPVLLVSSAKQPTRGVNGPVTITIESTMPLHPVRLAIAGSSGLTRVVADSFRTVADSLIVWTPARLTIGAGPVHVLLRVTPAESWLVLTSAELGRLEARGDRLKLRRNEATPSLQILAAAMRTTSN